MKTSPTILLRAALAMVLMFVVSVGAAQAVWSFEEEGPEFSSAAGTLTFLTDFEVEKKPGVVGEAVRFDGFTSYMSGSLDEAFPSNQFTISLYVALRCNPTQDAGIFSRLEDNLGLALEVDRHGKLTAQVGQGWATVPATSEQLMAPQAWHSIVIIVKPEQSIVQVYVDGEQWAEEFLWESSFSWDESIPLVFGRMQTPELNGLNTANSINGLLDEWKIDGFAWSEEQVQAHAELLQNTVPDFTIDPLRYSEDQFRPRFHALNDGAWTNEPHTFIYYDNKYHLFYQKNGNGPYWGQINWGHIASPDGVVWCEEPIALWPEPGWDSFGIWSGCGVVENGEPVLIYTGVDGSEAGVGTAVRTGNGWEKSPNNPVIDDPPSSFQTNDFRDPWVWKEGEFWYLIIGSGVPSSGGVTFLYRSTDLENWEYQSIFMFGQPDLDGTGYFWEMPVFLEFGEEDVFLANSAPFDGNPAELFYWTGTFEGGIFFPASLEPTKVDLLDGLLAPAFVQDEDRYMSIGIVPDDIAPSYQHNQGWANVYTLLREVRFEDGRMKQRAHPALEELRLASVSEVGTTQLSAGDTLFLDGTGRHWELEVSLDLTNSFQADILFAYDDALDQVTRLSISNSGDVQLNRNNSTVLSGTPGGVQIGSFALEDPSSIDVRLFFDGSIIDVFIDEQEAFSSRIYPNGALNTAAVVASFGEVVVNQAHVYSLGAACDAGTEEEPVADATPHSVECGGAALEMLSEVPAERTLEFALVTEEQAVWDLNIYGANGQLVEALTWGELAPGTYQQTLDLAAMSTADLVLIIELLKNDASCLTRKVARIRP